jgi:hypothetical protein
MGIVKKFLELYVDVFKNHSLALSITTLLFVIAYFAWTKSNAQKGFRPGAVWEQPAFQLFVVWLILTPFLGFIFSVLAILEDVLYVVIELYMQVFERYPKAGAAVTVIFVGAYLVWKLALRKRPRRITGVWSHPLVVLLAVWLIATLIVGLLLTLE